MKHNKRQVLIKLKTTINDKEHSETIQTEAHGTLIRRGNRDVLLYDEQTDDGAKISHLITLQHNKATIKRSGFISMHQQFVTNRVNETMYEHPHGTFHLKTLTKQLQYEPSSKLNSGKLAIDYTVSLNGQEEREHKLVLTYQEEDL